MKKFIALLLIFFIMMFPLNLHAKERRGAKLIITKKDGQQVGGEPITVKRTSLLLLNCDGKDESLEIADIKVIRVSNKSNALSGALLGIPAGLAIGVMVGLMIDEEWGAAPGAVIGIPLGTLYGGISGALEGIDKTIHLDGMTDSELQETLEKLRKKARVRDYK